MPVAAHVVRRLLPMVVASSMIAACADDDDDGVTSGPPTKVVIDYFETIIPDEAIAEAHPDCVRAVGRTHIHPSWKSFKLQDMGVFEGHWRITFERVPTLSLQSIRISDPNACKRDPCGASTRNVFANGVELTRIVDTPGGCDPTSTMPGKEPGLAFTVAEDGTVTP